MAESSTKLDFVMQDLQRHLQNANLAAQEISSIAKKGDEKLVEKFLSEAIFTRSSDKGKIELTSNTGAVLQSQLYVACFWGFKDVVKGILSLAEENSFDVDVNAQNRSTLWTPLHAATFQEHGPIILSLLERGADPELEDSEGRTSKDFASASDKVWPLFQALGLRKTPKHILNQMGILKKSDPGGGELFKSGLQSSPYGYDLQMTDHNPRDGRGHVSLADRGGDILSEEDSKSTAKSEGPMFKIYK